MVSARLLATVYGELVEEWGKWRASFWLNEILTREREA